MIMKMLKNDITNIYNSVNDNHNNNNLTKKVMLIIIIVF